MTAIEKKLKKYDDRLQRNLDDYTNDTIHHRVFNLRREKILRAKALKQEELEQQQKLRRFEKNRKAGKNQPQFKEVKSRKAVKTRSMPSLEMLEPEIKAMRNNAHKKTQSQAVSRRNPPSTENRNFLGNPALFSGRSHRNIKLGSPVLSSVSGPGTPARVVNIVQSHQSNMTQVYDHLASS